MSRFPLVEESDASPETAEVMADFRQTMGFPAAPNFVKTLAAGLPVIKGTWGVMQNVLVEGILPRTLKEMVFLAISEDRDCRYCQAAHAACCRMLGVDESEIRAFVSDLNNVKPKRRQDIIRFAVKCARAPQQLTDAEFEQLRDHQLCDAEILELIATSALAVYVDTIVDATQVEVDPMF